MIKRNSTITLLSSYEISPKRLGYYSSKYQEKFNKKKHLKSVKFEDVKPGKLYFNNNNILLMCVKKTEDKVYLYSFVTGHFIIINKKIIPKKMEKLTLLNAIPERSYLIYQYENFHSERLEYPKKVLEFKRSNPIDKIHKKLLKILNSFLERSNHN